MNLAKRIVRLLRSPRLAIWLIAGIVAYSAIATAVPQASDGAAQVAQWSSTHPTGAAIARGLGLFSAFASPLFLLAIALLAAALTACAWQRSAWALRQLRTVCDEPRLRAIRERPTLRTSDMPRRDAEMALDDLSAGLKHAGFAVTADGEATRVDRYRWAVLGSPMFHAALALMIVVVGAGRLSRSEGPIWLPISAEVSDATSSYQGAGFHGPLYRGHTGLIFSATGFEQNTLVGGIDRGASAVVTLSNGARVLARTRVYPNSPLRYGSLLVHPGTWGYAPVLRVTVPGTGQSSGDAPAYIDSARVTSQGVGPAELSASSGTSADSVLSVVVPYAPGTQGKQLQTAVLVSLSRAGEATGTTVLVPEGQTRQLSKDLAVEFVKPNYYVTVVVTDDWSVPFIYGLLAIAGVGLGIAILFQPSSAWLMVVPGSGAKSRVHVLVRHRRGDSAAPERLARIAKQVLKKGVEVTTCS